MISPAARVEGTARKLCLACPLPFFASRARGGTDTSFFSSKAPDANNLEAWGPELTWAKCSVCKHILVGNPDKLPVHVTNCIGRGPDATAAYFKEIGTKLYADADTSETTTPATDFWGIRSS
jgi:hypothetical protein